MRIKLNLLPKSLEKRIRNKKILKFIILQEIMIIVITILFFGVLKGVDTIAILQLNSINQELSQNGERGDFVEMKKYEEGLKEIKTKIGFIRQIQKFNIDWTVLFNKFAILLPQEITLNSIEGDGYGLLVKGIAQNRDALIKMKEELTKDVCFKNIDIPLNNIVLRENIDFELKFDIEDKCLNNYEKK